MHPFFQPKFDQKIGGGLHIISYKNKLLLHVDENFLGVQIIQSNISFFLAFLGVHIIHET